MSEPLLVIRNLAVASDGPAGHKTITTPTSFSLERGGTLAIVGESGSGKSLTAKAIARLLPEGVTSTGTVRLDGAELTALSENELRHIRGHKLSMLLQDPFTMMNPLMRCGEHIDEMLRDRPEFANRSARRVEVARRLAEVGITDPAVAKRMPFQLSGGMCQRVALAASLARDPQLLIADEPSTALDVTTQAEIMRLLKRAQEQRGMSLILITHDLRLAFATCERVCVMYAGSLVEIGATVEVRQAPLHPYTAGLLASEPRTDVRLHRLVAIKGSVPAADSVADRCSFADRCAWAAPQCLAGRPPLMELANGRASACIRLAEIGSELTGQRVHAETIDPAAARAPADAILQVDGLIKTFGPRGHGVHAVKGVSLYVTAGESVGLVGESGSGKTTIGRCAMGLEAPTAGTIMIDGVDATDFDRMSDADRRAIRSLAQMVFQDPYSTLNPKHSVRTILTEALRVAGADTSDRQIASLLDEVGLPAGFASRRPAMLSGGERQRVAIARALAVKPRLLVCDEPVSALDVSVQAQILNLLKTLQAERGLSLLFITHDLGVVRQIADRIYVLSRGEVVESDRADLVLDAPKHPYTRRLLSSIPGAMPLPAA